MRKLDDGTLCFNVACENGSEGSFILHAIWQVMLIVFEHIMYDACVPRLTVVHNHDAFKRIDVPYFDLFA